MYIVVLTQTDHNRNKRPIGQYCSPEKHFLVKNNKAWAVLQKAKLIPFVWTTWIPFTQVSFAIGFVISSTVVLKEIKMWNVFENKGFKKKNAQILIMKALLIFHLKLTCKFPCETNSKSEFHMKFIEKYHVKFKWIGFHVNLHILCKWRLEFIQVHG